MLGSQVTFTIFSCLCVEVIDQLLDDGRLNHGLNGHRVVLKDIDQRLLDEGFVDGVRLHQE